MARSRVQRLLPFVMGAILALTVGAACTTPTLPLPPPASPSIVEGTEPGTFHLSSTNGAEPNALILVVNRNEAVPRDRRVSGTIADTQGSWELDVPATSGDLLDISQESGTVRSPTITITVR
ncbi:hypothetical protein AKJ09_08828 [Labilithrix luteola]|uniref:Bacterial Ig domain-containing protein n=1 Tax=Labilithrix luteola TaxID=1391654 RepID=A0A0K1Q9S5_9BACT|nr:hypothetical protein [Labilithrix luteola]AKV02165.1 hypothetical protein AKJ09_08828 [Labilithrix luteola]